MSAPIVAAKAPSESADPRVAPTLPIGICGCAREALVPEGGRFLRSIKS